MDRRLGNLVLSSLYLTSTFLTWRSIQDDHEVADNSYRDGSSELNNTEASFIGDGGVSFDQRKMNAGQYTPLTAVNFQTYIPAVRAYFEWMPIRSVGMYDHY